MGSVAALYRIPDEAQSGKPRSYSLDELKRLVYYSGAPHSVRAGTLAALEARGAWPRGDGPATSIICVSLMGMMIDGGCCRSTAQRRVKRALKEGFWRKTREANSWTDCPKCPASRKVGKCASCGYKGDPTNSAEFWRPFTYELDVRKFESHPRCRQIHSPDWRTYKEYKAAAELGEHPNVTPIRKPAQPAAERKTTQAGPPTAASPTSEERKPLKITRDVRIAIAGCYSNARRQGNDEASAIRETCEALSSETQYLSESEVRLQLKIWQGKHGPLEPAKENPVFVPPAKCPSCGTALVQNFGPGPRLKCPQCSADSS